MIARALEPLGAVSGVRHVALHGSARDGDLGRAGDVDVHVVLDRMTAETYRRIVVAARQAAWRLAALGGAGDQWLIETRRGSLKPPPGGAHQLHLMLDDETSLQASSSGLRVHLAASGIRLAGPPLDSLVHVPATLGARLEGCDVELHRLIDALLADAVPCRTWVFDPAARMVEHQVPADDAWRRRNLLRGASAVGDRMLLVAAAVSDRALATVAAAPTVHAAIEPHVSEWATLERDWARARDETVQALHRRRSLIAAIGGQVGVPGPPAR